ncbi:sensor domain-containing diguanylate cyclase [Clostridium sp. C8-1-8]|uniref:sensor domain-containing diguanylate cyclase n=1 Tax=Clostridium sp. C8-1-8 TaxID=2698831 RepID=UPI0013717EC2|nr:sensor domain-containing diguanylate cyclase [Clostridium sp. C8-1-8]
MDDYRLMYERIREEFETYQNFAEKQLQVLNEKNIRLERDLDALANIVEVSKYINSYISDENLIPMINDMIVGILGGTYSTIYFVENGKLEVKATNSNSQEVIFPDSINKYIRNIEEFVVNSKDNIFTDQQIRRDIHSVIGFPIKIREKYIGYIMVEHTLYRFFTRAHIKFVASIANQIAIAIENSILYTKIQEASKRDPLLGIYNRKYFFEILDKRIKENPYNCLGIVMIDIDNFKKVNDSFGHQFGDETLQHVVTVIQSCLKSEDIIARYGGEEIIICLRSNETEEEMEVRVEETRRMLEQSPVIRENIIKTVTASIGLSFYPADGQTVDAVVEVADALLYKAKGSGKNRVISSLIFR